MQLSLSPNLQNLIQERVTSGRYASAEDVVTAAIMALDQQEHLGEFDPGELEKLLQAGERSIDQEGTINGEEAMAMRRARRAKPRNQSQ